MLTFRRGSNRRVGGGQHCSENERVEQRLRRNGEGHEDADVRVRGGEEAGQEAPEGHQFAGVHESLCSDDVFRGRL